MNTQKKKTIRENKSKSTRNKSQMNDKCPRKEKDCANCEILNCPEEVVETSA